MNLSPKFAVAKARVAKAREYLRNDCTGWSLLKHTCKWAFSRVQGKIGHLEVPHPERLAATGSETVIVAVNVTGGIGDYVVIARALRDMAALSASLRFHVFCPSVETGKWVFSLPCVEGVFDSVFLSGVRLHYDCVLNVGQFLYPADDEHFKLGRLTRLAPSFVQALAHAMKARKRWNVFIDHQPGMDGAFAHTAVALGLNRYTFLQSLLGLAPGPFALPLVCDDTIAADLSARFERWITINTGFDPTFPTVSRYATKCYPPDHWQRFVRAFKDKCRDVAVIQIGAKTSISIPGVDENLVSATSLAQAAAILKRAIFHVDNEGGLVHVAASLGTRSIVLFGPTSVKYFGYASNVNLSSDICGDCWWATDHWMDRCPKGHGQPRCLLELDPNHVADVAVAEIQCVTFEGIVKSATQRWNSLPGWTSDTGQGVADWKTPIIQGEQSRCA
jgi:hypothetical protein